MLPVCRPNRGSYVVGFNNIDIKAGQFYLLATQFDKTGTETPGAIDMNELIKLSDSIVPGTFDDGFVTAPQIQVLNSTGTGYFMYYYISDATDENDDPLGYDCWADDGGYELKPENMLTMGEGFWFKSLTAGSMSFAGQVKGEASAVQTVPAGRFYIMSNPFPTAFSLANVLTTGLTPGLFDDGFMTAPQIQVLNATGTGYFMYYYISDATDDNDDAVGYDCWADDGGYILEGNQVQPGASFWIKSPTAGSIGFNL